MTPRAAAQRVSDAAIKAMAEEWDELKEHFEPHRRDDFKGWVWDLVRTRLVGTKTIPPKDAEGN